MSNNNNKKYYSLITSCAVIISISSFIFDAWGIVLYYILNNNGDTSTKWNPQNVKLTLTRMKLLH